MDVNFEYYKTFYYVGKYKSFTKAAQVMFVAQPNVTRAIKSLEQQLGCELFVRSKRKVEFTVEGEKLFSYVKVAYDNIKSGEKELDSDLQLQSGIVNIGATEIALCGFLLPVLKKFHAKFPQIKLKIGNYTTKDGLKALSDKAVDLAVVTSPIPTNDKLTAVKLKSFYEIAVCGSDFSELTNKPVSAQTLCSYPLVGLAKSTITFDFYTQQFSALGLNYEPDIEVATANQILPIIENNLCVGFVPEFFLNGNSTVNHIQTPELTPTRNICLVKRADCTLSIAAKELEKEILTSATLLQTDFN